MIEAFGIVYLIRHKESGKGYVGQTTEGLARRWARHQQVRSPCILLRRAIKKYGAEAFEISVLREAQSKAELDSQEIHWIAVLGTLAPVGYNIMLGGQGGRMAPEAGRRAKATHIKTLARMAAEGRPKGPSPLRPQDVALIFAAANAGRSQKAIAAGLSLHHTTVSHILAGTTWSHLGLAVNQPRQEILSQNDALEMLRLFQRGKTVSDLCSTFGRTKGGVNKVLRGETYPHAFELVMGRPPNGKREIRAHRISDETATRAKMLRAQGWSYPTISKELGISVATAHRIANSN